MFSAPLERLSGGRATGGASLTLAVLSGYTIIAAVVAGGFAVPAGLFVFALGGVATMIVDHALWREAAFAAAGHGRRDWRSPERLDAPAAAAALPAPDPEPHPEGERRPAGRRRAPAAGPEA